MIVPRRLGIKVILLGLNGQIAHFGLCGCFDLAAGDAAGNGIGHLTNGGFRSPLKETLPFSSMVPPEKSFSLPMKVILPDRAVPLIL